MDRTDFADPPKTRKLFCEGYPPARDGRAWDERPPERAASEDRVRRGAKMLCTAATGSAAPITAIPGTASR